MWTEEVIYVYLARVDPPVDQFAFLPSGSPTFALVDFFQKTADMLLQPEYIVVISIDFTKTLDRVKHHALSLKSFLLQGPRSSPRLQAYKDRAHHCDSKLLLLFNVRFAALTIPRPPAQVVTLSYAS